MKLYGVGACAPHICSSRSSTRGDGETRNLLRVSFARRERPRERASKERCFVLKLSEPLATYQLEATTSGHSPGLAGSRGPRRGMPESGEEPTSPGEVSDVDEESRFPREAAVCLAEKSNQRAQVGTFSDAPVFIDEETAALIQHEQWASAVEARLGGLYSQMVIQNTFFHCPSPGVASPRTLRTV